MLCTSKVGAFGCIANPRTDFNPSVRGLMLIWYFCEPQNITLTHKPLDTHNKVYRAESYQNLINGLFKNLEALDITGFSDFRILFPLDKA